MATLKISDLSVGDWVRVINQFDAQIDGYHSESGSLSLKTRQRNLVHYRLEDIHPIPITAEILEKNGLEYIDDGNDAVIFLCCDMFWARLCVGDTFWQVGIHSEDKLDAVVCNIKHVHQLQHALRLAGVEKEIVMS